MLKNKKNKEKTCINIYIYNLKTVSAYVLGLEKLRKSCNWKSRC